MNLVIFYFLRLELTLPERQKNKIKTLLQGVPCWAGLCKPTPKSKEAERSKTEAVSLKETFSRNLETEAMSVSQVVLKGDDGSLHHYSPEQELIYHKEGVCVIQMGCVGQVKYDNIQVVLTEGQDLQ